MPLRRLGLVVLMLLPLPFLVFGSETAKGSIQNAEILNRDLQEACGKDPLHYSENSLEATLSYI